MPVVTLAGALALLLRSGGDWSISGLIIVIGVGLIGAGSFTADPITRRVRWGEITATGVLHEYFSIGAFLGVPVRELVAGPDVPVDQAPLVAACCFATAVACAVLFALAVLGFAWLPDFEPYAGLYQRIMPWLGFGWLVLLSVFLRGARSSRAFNVRVGTA